MPPKVENNSSVYLVGLLTVTKFLNFGMDPSRGSDSEEEEDHLARKAVASDTSDEGVDDPIPPGSARSDTSDSDVDTAVHDKRGRRRGNPKRRTGVSRKSKKAALDEIHSESNRMLRESDIHIPYHRPKQRSLEEFLNRKKSAPILVDNIKLNVNKVRVEESEKLLEMREKMAQDFYEEEDEDDGDDFRAL